MTKIDPQFTALTPISADSQRAKDFLNGLSGSVKRDAQDRFNWVEKKAYYQRRRYGMEDRHPQLPWVGSSNIVLPLADKSIDQLKPAYIDMITRPNPPVTAKALESTSTRKESNVEIFFEWLIKTGSPRFVEEMILCADNILEMGMGVLKSRIGRRGWIGSVCRCGGGP